MINWIIIDNDVVVRKILEIAYKGGVNPLGLNPPHLREIALVLHGCTGVLRFTTDISLNSISLFAISTT